MDNYLNYRWPQGPGLQPPPVPGGPGGPPRPKKKRSPRRWAAPVLAIVLCVSLLGGVCFWAVNGIAGMIAQIEPSLPEDPRPPASHRVERDTGWTPDDLPWGDPDPAVELSAQPAGPARSGREAYQAVLPSLVSVRADHGGVFQGSSLGTGVVVTRSGYVLTNYHIIDESVAIQVELLDGPSRYFDAFVIGYDQDFDLAVLWFDPDGTDLTPARLGDSDVLAVGDLVYAVGNPMGYLTGSMSMGIVSALDRELDQENSRTSGALGLIQIDAPINPGNSGGALVNESGQVVGITCAKITGVEQEDGGSIQDAVVLEGMGLAIPISDAIPFLNHILATGESWRPAMGIQCAAAQVDGRRGILVDQVTADPPRAAGLRRGDLILTANGVEVTTLAQLRRVLYRTGAEEELTCTVLRRGQELTISFPLTDSLKQDRG